MYKFQLLNELRGGVIPGTFSANVLAHTQAHTKYENEERLSKYKRAIPLVKGMIHNFPRPEIITNLEQRLNVKHSTAVTYYERIAKDLGMTNRKKRAEYESSNKKMVADQNFNNNQSKNIENNSNLFSSTHPYYFHQETNQQLPFNQQDQNQIDINDTIPQSDDPNRQGVIRYVDNAHLVFKRQNEKGTFDELWVYNIGDNINDELQIRRNILAGTDIPPQKTQSQNGSQSYTLTTLGNGQLLYISNLPQ